LKEIRVFFRSLAAALIVSVAALPAAQVPRQSPEYAFTLGNGQQALLSKYKGKVVVLEFLLTTCPACQETSRILSKLNSELGAKGFQPIGVAINPDADLTGFIRQYNVNFPVGKGSRESAYAYLQHSIMAPNFYVPQLVFIDRKGVIRGQYGGSDPFVSNNKEANIRAMVEKLLTEGAPAKSGGKASRKTS
jgi:cytochrome oxidase Cu insertion factor (SCO1/SenC/PrrC family)